MEVRSSSLVRLVDFLTSSSLPSPVIRPFGVRELHFSFKPSLPGAFHEYLQIENILDPSNVESVSIKANVKKYVTFWIKNQNLDFGSCMLDELSRSQSVYLVNITKHNRTFEIQANFEDWQQSSCLQAEFL